MTTINPQETIIDVREDDEFRAEHVLGSIHIPLSEFPAKAPAILGRLPKQEVIIMCRSGKRSQMALDQISTQNLACRPIVFSGGIIEWKKQGRPTQAVAKSPFPIMRQVQITAGLLVLISVLLSQLLAPGFVWVAGFVGAGLIFAGVSGFCGMAEMLRHMPWNVSK